MAALPDVVGSLFAGIGGLDLGLERAGLSVGWQVENDPFCRRVLERHWPGRLLETGDIRQVATFPHADIVCGGFPCQPVSSAGSRKAQDDDRWLWPEFERCIRAVRPRLVLVENVSGLLTAGGGSAFGDILGGLAELGFDAEWGSLSAASVGARHLRRRVFLIAYNERPQGRISDAIRVAIRVVRQRHGEQHSEQRPAESGDNVSDADSDGRDAWASPDTQYEGGAALPGDASNAVADTGEQGAPSTRGDGEAHGVADTNGRRREEFRQPEPGGEQGACGRVPYGHGQDGHEHSATWDIDPADCAQSGVGRVAYGVSHRVDRLRALGNAVVPQCAEVLGLAIVSLWGRPNA